MNDILLQSWHTMIVMDKFISGEKYSSDLIYSILQESKGDPLIVITDNREGDFPEDYIVFAERKNVVKYILRELGELYYDYKYEAKIDLVEGHVTISTYSNHGSHHDEAIIRIYGWNEQDELDIKKLQIGVKYNLHDIDNVQRKLDGHPQVIIKTSSSMRPYGYEDCDFLEKEKIINHVSCFLDNLGMEYINESNCKYYGNININEHNKHINITMMAGNEKSIYKKIGIDIHGWNDWNTADIDSLKNQVKKNKCCVLYAN